MAVAEERAHAFITKKCGGWLVMFSQFFCSSLVLSVMIVVNQVPQLLGNLIDLQLWKRSIEAWKVAFDDGLAMFEKEAIGSRNYWCSSEG